MFLFSFALFLIRKYNRQIYRYWQRADEEVGESRTKENEKLRASVTRRRSRTDETFSAERETSTATTAKAGNKIIRQRIRIVPTRFCTISVVHRTRAILFETLSDVGKSNGERLQRRKRPLEIQGIAIVLDPTELNDLERNVIDVCCTNERTQLPVCL